MPAQIVIIHGGNVFPKREDVLTYLNGKKATIDSFKPKKGWKENLADEFGKDFEMLYPKMPNKEDAKYEEWKIWFEKLVPFADFEIYGTKFPGAMRRIFEGRGHFNDATLPEIVEDIKELGR